jgi:tetratricopeptide (TPR) repeat protein
MRTIIVTLAAVCFSATAFAQSADAALYLQRGLQEKSKGRLMVAYKQFDSAYVADKTDKTIVAELAKTLFDLRRYGPAREKYMELEKLGGANAEVYNQLMTLSFNMRQFPDAIKYADLLKKADPTAKTAYYIGKAHYDGENYGDALKFLDIASKEEPSNAEIPYMIARSYSDMNNHKMAIPFFLKALELQPKNNRWMYEIGLIYYALHEDQNSIKYMEMAGENGYKKDNEYLENLAIGYLNTKQTDKGLDILVEALRRRPADMNLLNMIAEANYDAKRYDKAIEYWDQVLTLDKTSAASLFMIGVSYQKKGEKAKGQDLCDKAIAMDPSLAKNRQKMEMPGGL